MERVIRTLSTAICIFLVAIMAIVGFYSATLPDSFFVTENEPLSLTSVFAISSKPCKAQSYYASKLYGDSISEITKVSDSTLMLFDSIPIKRVTEKTVDRPLLVPCGQPFGVRLMTDGVMVVKLEKFDGACPASECGIEIGDVVTSVNGKAVDSNKKIGEIISDSKGNPCEIEYKRNDKVRTATLTPMLYDGSYKAGMWVRDSSAGIGTLTFYNPENSSFGGLGHPICDADTKVALPLSKGSVGEVEITGFDKSKNGNPGQLLGEFTSSAKTGLIYSNSECGIFGSLYSCPAPQKAIPLGFRQEIHSGKATILSTIDGQDPKEYDVEIEKIDLQENAEHDMVVRITDKKLLGKTGGIVQGMSGSPIIQDGRLVGAVTHVFIDSPEYGYAVFADSMYEQSCSCCDKSLDSAS
ncbi:MAG: SpoIVB peptidase [Ruminococcus sp.]|nr:SpoIVB peptidase [Ruminococcus sp.]